MSKFYFSKTLRVLNCVPYFKLNHPCVISTYNSIHLLFEIDDSIKIYSS